MVHAFVEFSLDDLKKDLAQAQELMKTDQPRAMKKSLYAVSHFLKSQGIEPDLLRPLDDMAIGFLDLQIGNHPKFFKPNSDAARTMPIPDAAKKAIASAAITLAPMMSAAVTANLYARGASREGKSPALNKVRVVSAAIANRGQQNPPRSNTPTI